MIQFYRSADDNGNPIHIEIKKWAVTNDRTRLKAISDQEYVASLIEELHIKLWEVNHNTNDEIINQLILMIKRAIRNPENIYQGQKVISYMTNRQEIGKFLDHIEFLTEDNRNYMLLKLL